MKRKLILILSCFTLLFFTLNLPAMDGKRKGVVWGIGVGKGFTAYSMYSSSWEHSDDYRYWYKVEITSSGNSMAHTTDFKIGYGATNQILIVYTNKLLWFSFKDPDWSEGQVTLTGASMVGISYFFKPDTPSFFTSLGVGASVWTPFTEYMSADKTWLGLGLFTGIGYEFSPHWMIEVSGILGLGGAGDNKDAGRNPFSVMITINWLEY